MPYFDPLLYDVDAKRHRPASAGDQVATSHIPVSLAANNQISMNADGLFSPPAPELNVQDIISNISDNAITAPDDKLYVPLFDPRDWLSNDTGNTLILGTDGKYFAQAFPTAAELISQCENNMVEEGCDGGIFVETPDWTSLYCLAYDKVTGNLDITYRPTGEVMCTVRIVSGSAILKDVSIVVNPAGQPEGTYIQFVFTTTAGDETIYLDVTDLIDIYTSGNAAITVDDYVITLVVNPDGALYIDDNTGLNVRVATTNEAGVFRLATLDDIRNGDNTAVVTADQLNGGVSRPANWQTVRTPIDVHNASGVSGYFYSSVTGNTNIPDGGTEPAFLTVRTTTDYNITSFLYTNRADAKSWYKWADSTGLTVNEATESFSIETQFSGSVSYNDTITVSSADAIITATIDQKEYYSGTVLANGKKSLSGRIRFRNPEITSITNAILSIDGIPIVAVSSGNINIGALITKANFTVRVINAVYDTDLASIDVWYTLNWTNTTGTETFSDWIRVGGGEDVTYLPLCFTAGQTERLETIFPDNVTSVTPIKWSSKSGNSAATLDARVAWSDNVGVPLSLSVTSDISGLIAQGTDFVVTGLDTDDALRVLLLVDFEE